MIPTSNHNRRTIIYVIMLLYIFWFLHQTTTTYQSGNNSRCCISFDSYIKPQLVIWIACGRSVVYLLIPTSNHNFVRSILLFLELYIFWFLHQTTTRIDILNIRLGCISFDSYIKPQLVGYCKWWQVVVYLLIPTSNHNHVMLS